MNENSFVTIPIYQFRPDEELCADLYLKIDQKFVCYKHAGDSISAEKMNQFFEKQIGSFFVDRNDLPKIIEWLKQIIAARVDAKISDLGEEARPVAVLDETIRDQIYDTFSKDELDNDSLFILQQTASNIIEKVSVSKEAQTFLANMVSFNSSIADHAVNVANIALYFGLVFGEGHSIVLNNLYIGALLHDYAKAKIPQSVLDDSKSMQYMQAIHDHPQKAVKILSNLPEITDSIKRIILEHHEQYNGRGYPNALSGEKIYRLAQITSLANMFCKSLEANDKKSRREKFKIAYKVFEYDNGKYFAPDLIAPVLKALEFAYKRLVDTGKQ